MKFRSLGKWGLKLSEISIGTMYHGSYISKEQSHRVLKAAVDNGINYLDCADRYGIHDSELPLEQRTPAEIVLGEFLKDYERSDLVISSKIWYQMNDKNPNSGGLSRKHIRESIKTTLKNLGTDYLDIYFCHRPDRTSALEETILTMSNLIDEGTILYWGTSWWPPVLIERVISLAKELGAHPIHVEQPPYHMFARFIETKDETIDLAKYHGLGLTTFEALATGLFTGKYQNVIPPGSRYDAEDSDLASEVLERYREVLPPLMEIAKSLEITMSQLAIAWTLRNKEVTSSITGASKPEQVVENVHASEVNLSKEIIKQIDEIIEKTRPRPRYYYQYGYYDVSETLIRG
ncbi:MAG: aldo/keto reductase [Candidatus Hermodarchaeota archaeon]